MDIKKVLDALLESEAELVEEKRLLLCEFLLQEFNQMSVKEVNRHLENMILCKRESRCIVTLSFPITFNMAN